jgi:HTH-type transcriptional regulator/antitoxin HigA
MNPEVYGQLLSEFKPQVIITEIEHERAISLAETLANKSVLTPEEDQLLELLIALIEKFESEKYNISNSSTPLSCLLFLMENNNLSEYDLAKIFGSKELVLEVINGQIDINKKMAIKLGKRFNLDTALFLC